MNNQSVNYTCILSQENNIKLRNKIDKLASTMAEDYSSKCPHRNTSQLIYQEYSSAEPERCEDFDCKCNMELVSDHDKLNMALLLAEENNYISTDFLIDNNNNDILKDSLSQLINGKPDSDGKNWFADQILDALKNHYANSINKLIKEHV